MQKIKILAIAVVAITLAASPVHANFREIHVQYFTDANLNNFVGETTDWCDDSSSSWGNINAVYLGHFEISCSTEEVSNVSCYHWNGSSYEPVDCQYDSALGRIRIPIGR